MIVIGLASTVLIYDAHASVTISGTRVVYPLGQREVTVKLDNDSLHPSLVQVWMDDGKAAAKPGDIQVPFVITPPIFRMEPKKSQVLRVMYSGEPLPSDRESVYWLNVLDIPPKQKMHPTPTRCSWHFAYGSSFSCGRRSYRANRKTHPPSWTGRS
jgi:chaperone protein EcpD